MVCMRTAGIVVCLSLAALLVPYAQAQGAGSCASGRIIGDGGPTQNAKLQICLPALRNDPTVVALLAKLEQLRAENADSRRDVARLLEAMQTTSTGLTPVQLQSLAESIARRLAGDGARAGERALREVERLRLSMEDFHDKRVAAQALPEAAGRVQSAISGPAGDAIARLDFEQAGRILDTLGRIERDVKLPCASDPELMKVTRADADKALTDLRAGDAERRCASGWRNTILFLQSAEQAQQRGDLNAACLALGEFTARAERLVGELQVADIQSQGKARLQAQHLRLLTTMFNNDVQQAQSVDRPNAMRRAGTPPLRAEIDRADRLLASAQALWQQQQGNIEALKQITDARNIYRQVESIGGNYAQPLMPLRERHVPAAPSLEFSTTTIPGAVCR